MNPPAVQAYYETAVFCEFFCGIAKFAKFFCGNTVFSNPQCPPPASKKGRTPAGGERTEGRKFDRQNGKEPGENEKKWNIVYHFALEMTQRGSNPGP